MTSAASKSSPCDERLFALYKQTGDETYFEMVYNRRKEGIRRFLLKFLHPRRHDQIDDLIQTVFAELHRLSPRFDAGNFSVNGWLLQSAESFARDLIRRVTARKRSTGVPEAAVSELDRVTVEDPSRRITRREETDWLHQMVHRLPLDEQEAVIVALEGLSRRESAAELGITAGMYQGRLARGLALIQGMVNEPLEPVFSKDTCLGAAHLEEYLGAFQI